MSRDSHGYGGIDPWSSVALDRFQPDATAPIEFLKYSTSLEEEPCRCEGTAP